MHIWEYPAVPLCTLCNMLIYDVILHDIKKSHLLIYGNIQWHSHYTEMLKNDYILHSNTSVYLEKFTECRCKFLGWGLSAGTQ